MPRKGENIYKRKDGRWEGRYIKQRISGSVKYGYVYGKSYLEAKKKLEFEKVQHYQKTKVKSDAVSVIEFRKISELWLADIRATLKESSYIKYRNMLSSYINPRIGDIATQSVDYVLLSAYVSELLTSGGTKGTGLSGKTAADILVIIKSILKYASRCKYKVDLSAMNVSVKQKNTPVKTMESADYRRLIEYLQLNPTPLNRGILICAFTGIRIGELCALTWGDFSFEKKILHIHKTMQRIQLPDGDTKTHILITEPKSQCSIRDIPIPEILMSHLGTQRVADAYVLTECSEWTSTGEDDHSGWTSKGKDDHGGWTSTGKDDHGGWTSTGKGAHDGWTSTGKDDHGRWTSTGENSHGGWSSVDSAGDKEHTGTGPTVLEGAYPDEKELKTIRMFLNICTVVMGVCTLGIALLWCIPIRKKILDKMDRREPISDGLKVAATFVGLIPGLLLLVNEDI